MRTSGPLAQQVETLTAWVRGRVTQAGARGLVVGLSGGIDSAVVIRLCQLAMPEAVLGVVLSCHSDPQDEADARLVADHFRLPVIRVALEAPYDALLGDLHGAIGTLAGMEAADERRSTLARANVKPRLRMVALYYLANALDYLVAGTGNRSELTIGYFTKYGDGGSDLLPIGNLLKREVRALAAELGVPDRIIQKPPSAGLWKGQTDEAEMGFTYDDLEAYLEKGPETVAPALGLRIERLIRSSEHKRATPPIPDDEP